MHAAAPASTFSEKDTQRYWGPQKALQMGSKLHRPKTMQAQHTVLHVQRHSQTTPGTQEVSHLLDGVGRRA